jgi:ribose 5-phosphate isomerase B
MAMSANKVPGCRAAVIHNEWEAEMSRRHNDANVACFGARSMGPDVVQASLSRFLGTEFDGGRHAERVGKMNRLDGSAA